MSALSDYEDALRALLKERTTGDDETAWPVLAWVTYAVVTDPESMNLEEPEWIVPEGQMTFVTRGLIEQARTELATESSPMSAYVVWDEDSEEDG